MNRAHGRLERCASVVALLQKKSRTAHELRHLLGMTENTTSLTTINRILRVFESEGLTQIVGTRVRPGRGRQPAVWAWVPNQ